MILVNFVKKIDNLKFASVNKSLELTKKKISGKFNGMYGIHSVAVSNPEQKIKVFVDKMSDLDVNTKKEIKQMAGKYSVEFHESPVKNSKNYHLEESF